MTVPEPAEHDEVLRSTAELCSVHGRHVPSSHVNERHHIWPQGHGGPTVPENLVVTCATGHNNIHQLISIYLTRHGAVPREIVSQYTRGERRYAKLGYERIVRRSL